MKKATYEVELSTIPTAINIKDYRNAIIEECARVAENRARALEEQGKSELLAVAAAIRALKDRP